MNAVSLLKQVYVCVYIVARRNESAGNIDVIFRGYLLYATKPQVCMYVCKGPRGSSRRIRALFFFA
jgi:hypothetical protein